MKNTRVASLLVAAVLVVPFAPAEESAVETQKPDRDGDGEQGTRDAHRR